MICVTHKMNYHCQTAAEDIGCLKKTSLKNILIWSGYIFNYTKPLCQTSIHLPNQTINLLIGQNVLVLKSPPMRSLSCQSSKSPSVAPLNRKWITRLPIFSPQGVDQVIDAFCIFRTVLLELQESENVNAYFYRGTRFWWQISSCRTGHADNKHVDCDLQKDHPSLILASAL